jgi:endonuclease/exonuclease/phosphatase family metal-dependent hydrolase
VRLLSWNIRDLLGDPLAVHRVVRSAQADVVCLQEAPRRPGAALRLALLERGTGLRCVAGGRRSGGTAVFTAPHVGVEWAWAFRLPVVGPFTRTRGASVADLVVPGLGEVTVASVHLPLRADERLDHVRRVREVVRWRGRPGVIAGDLNEPPGAPAWTAWEPLAADVWADDAHAGPTFPAHDPRVRIDALLTAPGLLATVPDPLPWDRNDVRRASDHLPVLAVITAVG